MFNKAFRAGCGLFLTLSFSQGSLAANWLQLQGTEPGSTAARAEVWGFIQGQYQQDLSKANSAGTYIPPKLIAPNLTSQSMFNINRARIGVRGNGMPIDSKVNYFILSELGNNGLTNSGDRVKLTDASVTLNHIPFARIRIGLFKYPGSEEGLQAIHVSDYINFTTVTNQLMQERFPNNDNYYKTQLPNNDLVGNTEAQILGVSPNGFEKPIGGFRDVGVQVFDWVKSGNWEHSYALMMGNGNGANFGDNNGNKNIYAYWASEMLFNGEGKGPQREGVKLYGWYQKGKRTYDTDFTSTGTAPYVSSKIIQLAFYDRTRSGVGVKYLKSPFRAAAEYMTGSGMIFLGQQKESFDMNVPGGDGDGLLGKASGWYVDGGWKVFDTRFELDMRYDVYNRLKGDLFEVKYSTITFGGQYFINLKTRVALNYEYRTAKSVTGNIGLQDNFSGLGGRLSAQVTAIY